MKQDPDVADRLRVVLDRPHKHYVMEDDGYETVYYEYQPLEEVLWHGWDPQFTFMKFDGDQYLLYDERARAYYRVPDKTVQRALEH